MKNTLSFTYGTNILVPILVTLLKMRPHYSQSSRENATPSSGTFPIKEVPPPPVCSLRTVCGLFNVLQNLYVKGLWDGTYGLSSLSKKTRKYNRLQYLYKWSTFFSVIKDSKCWSRRGLNQRPPARQTGAYPTELTGRRLIHSKSGPLYLLAV